MKKIFLFVMILFVAAPAFCANTTTVAPGKIHIVLDGSSDWLWTDAVTAGISDRATNAGIKIYSIQFIPSAASDRLVIRSKSNTGTKIYDTGVLSSTDPWKDTTLNPIWEYPVIEADDLVLSTPANASIIIRGEW